MVTDSGIFGSLPAILCDVDVTVPGPTYVLRVQVSLTVNPHNAMIVGLALALLLGGVANGVVPNQWQLDITHPVLWLDYLSYTR
jgi:hypothetical protein